MAVDELRAVIAMEAEDGKRELPDQIFEDRDEEVFGDFFDRADDLELGDLIDGIDVINPFIAVQIALMHRIYAGLPGLPLGAGFRRSPIKDGLGRVFVKCIRTRR